MAGRSISASTTVGMTASKSASRHQTVVLALAVTCAPGHEQSIPGAASPFDRRNNTRPCDSAEHRRLPVITFTPMHAAPESRAPALRSRAPRSRVPAYRRSAYRPFRPRASSRTRAIRRARSRCSGSRSCCSAHSRCAVSTRSSGSRNARNERDDLARERGIVHGSEVRSLHDASDRARNAVGQLLR